LFPYIGRLEIEAGEGMFSHQHALAQIMRMRVAKLEIRLIAPIPGLSTSGVEEMFNSGTD